MKKLIEAMSILVILVLALVILKVIDLISW